MTDIRISRRLTIPESEVELRFARSGGPGGQHVNTASTKVELRFSVDDSEALDEDQKARIHDHLGNRITKDGVLILTSSEHRSQAQNRRAVTGRFGNLIAEALRPRKRRRRTRPTRGSKERRLEEKRQRAEKKRLRQDPEPPPGW